MQQCARYKEECERLNAEVARLTRLTEVQQQQVLYRKD
jgi:hypothetical protein